MSRGHACVLAAAGLLAAVAAPSRALEPSVASADRGGEPRAPAPDVAGLVEQIAGIPDVASIEIAPDGSSVAFALRGFDRESDETRVDWWVHRLDTGASHRVDPLREARSVRWLPTSRELLALIPDGEATVLRRIRFVAEAAITVRDYPLALRAVSSVSISNGGQLVAVVSEGAVDDNEARPGWPREYEAWARLQAPVLGLHLLDLGSGSARRLGAPGIGLAPHGEPSWSPDDRAIAATLDHAPDSQGMDTAVVAFDVESGTVRTLADGPGLDASPSWSPDGRSLVYFSHLGQPAYRGGWPVVLDLASNTATRFPEDAGPRGLLASAAVWMPGSRGFYYPTAARMRYELVRLRSSGDAFEPCPAPFMAGWSIALRSFSRDRRRMAFSASTPTDPPQIYVAELDGHGCPRSEGRPIWEQDRGASFADRVRSEEVSWPSGDGRFRIHATLLSPIARDAPVPGVLYLEGGPQMVTANFGNYVWDRFRLVLALRGFAVLAPNTRGRAGYGEAFQDGIRDGGRVALPFQDAALGLDRLIEIGMVDPRRQAVAGFSYGGLLSAHAVARSRRFRAAVVHEGAADMMRFAYPPEPGTYGVLAMRELGGITDPFAPAQWQALLEQSPGFNMREAETPTLLLYGARSLVDDGKRLRQALRRYEVPVRFLVYDEGHAFAAPSSLISSINETVNWIERHTATP